MQVLEFLTENIVTIVAATVFLVAGVLLQHLGERLTHPPGGGR